MLYEFHMLKNYPPTNLNRDDTGSPKSCLFGGVQRGRISSQCLKRSWRQSDVFQGFVSKELESTRTRWVSKPLNLLLNGIEDYNDDLGKAVERITGIEFENDKKIKHLRSKQVVIYSKEDVSSFVSIIKEAGGTEQLLSMDEKKLAKLIKNHPSRPISVDVALFGRMVTSEYIDNVEAAMQVAHAISTNAVSQESDFYTAVDDLVNGGSENDAGAGMMGDTDFNSNCYYIYAALDMDQLRDNLEHSPEALSLADGIARCLLETMAFSNPSGKQNSFAGHALPDVVCVEEKERKIPVSYANAFVKPARPTGTKDLVEESADKLAREIDSIAKQFGLDVKRRVWFCRKGSVQPPADALKTKSFQDLLRLLDGDGN